MDRGWHAIVQEVTKKFTTEEPERSTYTHAHTHMHAYTHTCIHTRAHTHAHTHNNIG